MKMSSRLAKRFYRPEGIEDSVLDRGATADAENRFVFEISWEVVNKGKKISLSSALKVSRPGIKTTPFYQS